MNLTKCNMGQLLFLARYTVYRSYALVEFDRRVKGMKGREIKRHDWHKEIYALYKGEELIADGTVYEIARKLNKRAELIKFYSYNCHKKRTGNKGLTLEFLGDDDIEDY